MPIFNLSCQVTVSAYTKIEADTLDDAIAEGELRDVAIGGLHTRSDPREVWIIDEADGSPEGIHGD